MTDTNQLPPHTITINDHPEPHIMQWSDLELAAIKKYAESYALQALAQVQGEPFAWVEHHKGGDNLVWDEPGGRKSPLYTTPQPSQATQAEVTDFDLQKLWLKRFEGPSHDPVVNYANLVLALRPAAVPMTPREIELIDGMIAVQLDHAQRCDAIGNRVMGEKQKGWDMERVELLRRIRSFGITAQAKKEAP